MKIDLRNTDLEAPNSPFRNHRIAMVITGEPAEKHPALLMAVYEKEMPGLGVIWGSGRSVEFLGKMGTCGNVTLHERTWGYILGLDNELDKQPRERVAEWHATEGVQRCSR